MMIFCECSCALANIIQRAPCKEWVILINYWLATNIYISHNNLQKLFASNRFRLSTKLKPATAAFSRIYDQSLCAMCMNNNWWNWYRRVTFMAVALYGSKQEVRSICFMEISFSTLFTSDCEFSFYFLFFSQKDGNHPNAAWTICSVPFKWRFRPQWWNRKPKSVEASLSSTLKDYHWAILCSLHRRSLLWFCNGFRTRCRFAWKLFTLSTIHICSICCLQFSNHLSGKNCGREWVLRSILNDGLIWNAAVDCISVLTVSFVFVRRSSSMAKISNRFAARLAINVCPPVTVAKSKFQRLVALP